MHKNYLKKIDCTLIIGPTASGKSSISLNIAKEKGGEIINADSVQLYAPLPILSAQPSLKDLSSCPHHMYGCLDGTQSVNVAWWYEKVSALIQDIDARGCHPIIVGGTGMYISTLLDGFSDIPAVSQEVLEEVKRIQEHSKDNLFNTLKKHDPLMAERLHPNDTQRLLRALSVFLQTQKSIAFYQTKKIKKIDIQPHIISMDIPRDALRKRIQKRLDDMFQKDVVKEVEVYLKHHSFETLAPTFKKTIGFSEIKNIIEGHLSIDEARKRIFFLTCQYAKRQSTWIRHQIKC